jgi:hypothetical protein
MPAGSVPELWISHTGWGLSHVLRLHSEHVHLGASYAKTLCGRTVMTSNITSAGYEDRCRTCERRSTAAEHDGSTGCHPDPGARLNTGEATS